MDATLPNVSRPSSPADELAARRNWSGPTLANGVLTAELGEFCQSGVAVVMATCGADGRPVVGRGLAFRIDRDGHARVLLRTASNAAFLRALGDGAGLAVTFTQPSTHRSIQLKAGGAVLSTVDASDREAVAVQTASLRAEFVEDGYSEAFAATYCGYEPDGLAAVDFVPESAFVQTPGPNAGSALQP